MQQGIDIEEIIAVSEQASRQILMIYRQSSFEVMCKIDQSFLTQADMESHAIICAELKKLYPHIPVISEESHMFHDDEARKNFHLFFLVDPLDGTKEFVERNDEFTINIALIHQNVPVLGVVHVPAQDVIYFAEKNQGAYKRTEGQTIRLSSACNSEEKAQKIVISRSHTCAKTEEFLASLHQPIEISKVGSALKFGLIAEGLADIYPRFTPTMEWDTAAGDILVTEAGKSVMTWDGEILSYNKRGLRNNGFVVR